MINHCKFPALCRCQERRVEVKNVADQVRVRVVSGHIFGIQHKRKYFKPKDTWLDLLLGRSYSERINKTIVKYEKYVARENERCFVASMISDKTQGALR